MDLLGESRTILARYLWFTAENYHEMLEKQGASGFKEKDVIPIYRIISHLDPKLEDAYDILAADMFFGFKDPRDHWRSTKDWPTIPSPICFIFANPSRWFGESGSPRPLNPPKKCSSILKARLKRSIPVAFSILVMKIEQALRGCH